MVLFVPALLGGLGLSHLYASRELDHIAREAEEPFLKFWHGTAIGLVAGVWIGANFHSFFLKVFGLVSYLFDTVDEPRKLEDDEASTSEAK